MATAYTRNTYVNGSVPALSAENLNKAEEFIAAVASGGAGSVVKADNSTQVAATTPSAVGLSIKPSPVLWYLGTVYIDPDNSDPTVGYLKIKRS